MAETRTYVAKAWYTDSAIWLNVLAFLLAVQALPETKVLVPEHYLGVLGSIIAILNLGVRFFITSRPVALTAGTPVEVKNIPSVQMPPSSGGGGTVGPRAAMIALIAGSLFTVSCANNPAAKLSPEGKTAYYGEKFMSGVEVAQKQVISLVGTAGITREDITPAVQVFGQIGKAGQELATILNQIDKSNVTADKQAAAVRARAAIEAIQGYVYDLSARVTSETARTRIVGILNAVKIASTVFDMIQAITPWLPTQPQTTMQAGPALTSQPAEAY